MDYITFLKKINELSDREWSAKITKSRDYLVIIQDGNVAIDYDNKYKDGLFSLFALGGAEGKAIDLIYAFAQSKDPFNTNKSEEKSMHKSEIVETYEDDLDVMREVLIDQIDGMIEEHHAE